MINPYNVAQPLTLYNNRAAAEAVVTHDNYANDPYNTYHVVENNRGRFVIEIHDEDGYVLGVL